MYILPPPHAPRPSLARADVEFRTCVSAPQAHLKTMRVNGVLRTTVRISSWSRCQVVICYRRRIRLFPPSKRTVQLVRRPPRGSPPVRPRGRGASRGTVLKDGLFGAARPQGWLSPETPSDRGIRSRCRVLSSYILHSTAPGTGGANIPPRPAACAYMTLT